MKKQSHDLRTFSGLIWRIGCFLSLLMAFLGICLGEMSDSIILAVGVILIALLNLLIAKIITMFIIALADLVDNTKATQEALVETNRILYFIASRIDPKADAYLNSYDDSDDE